MSNEGRNAGRGARISPERRAAAAAASVQALRTAAGDDIAQAARAAYGDVYWAFSHHAEAWYAKEAPDGRDPDVVDELHVMLAHREGGVIAEGSLTWHKLGAPLNISPRLELFDDAWAVFFILAPAFFTALAEVAGAPVYDDEGLVVGPMGDTSPAAVMARLAALGFVDTTPRTSPYDTPHDGVDGAAGTSTDDTARRA